MFQASLKKIPSQKFINSSISRFLVLSFSTFLLAWPTFGAQIESSHAEAKSFDPANLGPHDIASLGGRLTSLYAMKLQADSRAISIKEQLQQVAALVLEQAGQAAAPEQNVSREQLKVLQDKLAALRASVPEDVINKADVQALLTRLQQRSATEEQAAVRQEEDALLQAFEQTRQLDGVPSEGPATPPAAPYILRPRVRYFPEARPFFYAGPDSKDPFTYTQYDPAEIIAGKPMRQLLKYSGAWWHTSTGQENHPLGLGQAADMFGGPARQAPWLQGSDSMQIAINKVHMMFEFLEIMGFDYFTAHDRDLAPVAYTRSGKFDFARTEKNLRTVAELIKSEMDRTGKKPLWFTSSLFGASWFRQGAAVNPEIKVAIHALAQVKIMLEIAKDIGAENFVFWGGREGFDSPLNSDTQKMKEALAWFLIHASDHATKIGFDGNLFDEPKPYEPTAYQMSRDVAATMNFWREFGLVERLAFNIEANHATLAGLTFVTELLEAARVGKLLSLDANVGSLFGMAERGWDWDNPPTLGVGIEAGLALIPQGGFQIPKGRRVTGGTNFDFKTPNTTTDSMGILRAHRLAANSMAQGFRIAAQYLKDPRREELFKARYASQSTPLAALFKSTQFSAEQAYTMALNDPQVTQPEPPSGQIEVFNELLQEHIGTAHSRSILH